MIKLIIFESFEIGYLTCFLPIKFVKSTLKYGVEEVYID